MSGIVEHDLTGLGRAFAPQGEGPFPAVLLLHGSEGRLGYHANGAAARLAAEGFLACPFGYSVGDSYWNGGDILRIPLEGTAEALARLRAHPMASGKAGLYGWSRGAEQALILASLLGGDPGAPDALAAHAPHQFIGGAWLNDWAPGRRLMQPRPRDAGLAAWTWRGADLEPLRPIEIERYGGPVFLSHGVDDDLWDVERTLALKARLKAAGRTPEVHIYDGEGHILSAAAHNLQIERLAAFFGRALG
jgi:dipeptidyl aminopeptidase/acylaminoacyl peptidase